MTEPRVVVACVEQTGMYLHSLPFFIMDFYHSQLSLSMSPLVVSEGSSYLGQSGNCIDLFFSGDLRSVSCLVLASELLSFIYCCQKTLLCLLTRAALGGVNITPSQIFAITHEPRYRYRHETGSTFLCINLTHAVKIPMKSVGKF